MTSTRHDHKQLLTAAVVFAAACGSSVPARVDTIDGHDVEIATAGDGGAVTSRSVRTWSIGGGSHPTMLDAMSDPRVPRADEGSVTLTASIGARVHFHVGKVSIRPGLSYTRGFDGLAPHGPMAITKQTNAVAIAIPVLF